MRRRDKRQEGETKTNKRGRHVHALFDRVLARTKTDKERGNARVCCTRLRGTLVASKESGDLSLSRELEDP